LTIRSDLALPELPAVAADPAPDLRIRLAADAQAGGRADDVRLRFDGVGCFRARAGREIDVALEPGVDPAIARYHLMRPALGLVLHQRGWLVLHASAVSAGEGALVFVGDSGRGKSSLAAALERTGHSILADDLVAIHPGSDPPALAPGPGAVHLWPETAAVLGLEPERLTPVAPGHLKRRHCPATRGVDASPHLARVFVLDRGRRRSLRILGPAEACVSLARNGYFRELLEPAELGSQLERCAAVARRVPVHRFARPWSLAHLDRDATYLQGRTAAGSVTGRPPHARAPEPAT
jgi:hypothetical protein